MGNWNNPQLTTQYDVFLAECKERDVDAITLCLNAPTSPPVGAVKMVRLGAGQVKLQEFGGSVFSDVVLNVAGGGTGAGTAAGARTALGIGTMGIQNANTVAITGGTIVDLTALHLRCSLTLETDNSYDLGAFARQFRKGYFKSALVLPVGTDKYATS